MEMKPKDGAKIKISLAIKIYIATLSKADRNFAVLYANKVRDVSYEDEDRWMNSSQLKKFIAECRGTKNKPPLAPIKFVIRLFKMNKTIKVFNEEVISRNDRITKSLKDPKFPVVDKGETFKPFLLFLLNSYLTLT